MQVTTLTRARPDTNHYRTTVPTFIVKQYNLKQGDRLVWRIETKTGKQVITVEPLKLQE